MNMNLYKVKVNLQFLQSDDEVLIVAKDAISAKHLVEDNYEKLTTYDIDELYRVTASKAKEITSIEQLPSGITPDWIVDEQSENSEEVYPGKRTIEEILNQNEKKLVEARELLEKHGFKIIKKKNIYSDCVQIVPGDD